MLGRPESTPLPLPRAPSHPRQVAAWKLPELLPAQHPHTQPRPRPVQTLLLGLIVPF